MIARFRRPGRASGGLGRARPSPFALLGPLALFASAGCDALLGIDEVDLWQGAETPGGAAGEGGAGASGPGAGGTAGSQTGSGGGAGASGGSAGAPPLQGAGGAGGLGGQGGDEGGAGGTGGVGGQGGAGGCPPDDFEPNDAPTGASGLGKIEACGPAKQVSATLSGADDEDWFTAQGTVGLCLNAEPKASLAAAGPSQICYYLKPSSAFDFGCSTGSVANDVPGFKGCCTESSVVFIYEQSGLSDPPATLLLRVAPRASSNVCFPYTITYDF